VTGSAPAAQGSPAQATAPPAALELYALETELAAASSRAAALEGEVASVRAERRSARRGLAAATSALRASERTLARLVRDLYVAGETDPLAVLLGARSLDEAITGIDSLRRTARQSRLVGNRARTARETVTRRARALAARERRLVGLQAEARAHAAVLARTLERRRAYLAALRRRAGEARAAAALSAARSAQRRSASVTAEAAGTAVAPEPTVVDETPTVVRGVRTMTVDAVAYSLPGRTASGLPVGRGVVAVDPAVIPLGTRMVVPGYGPAVAADVGTAIKGAIIDLWFPTLAEAEAWGRRTVTIAFP
jgi:3D (Asp-Asp-Asp) domain-containing protein